MLFELDHWTKQMNFSVFAGVAAGLVIYWTQSIVGYLFENQNLSLSILKISISLIVALFCLVIFMIVNAALSKFKGEKWLQNP